jgi:hypothetical protein
MVGGGGEKNDAWRVRLIRETKEAPRTASATDRKRVISRTKMYDGSGRYGRYGRYGWYGRYGREGTTGGPINKIYPSGH